MQRAPLTTNGSMLPDTNLWGLFLFSHNRTLEQTNRQNNKCSFLRRFQAVPVVMTVLRVSWSLVLSRSCTFFYKHCHYYYLKLALPSTWTCGLLKALYTLLPGRLVQSNTISVSWEISSHAAIEDYSYTNIHYLPKVLNTAANDSNSGPLNRESKALPVSHCATTMSTGTEAADTATSETGSIRSWRSSTVSAVARAHGETKAVSRLYFSGRYKLYWWIFCACVLNVTSSMCNEMRSIYDINTTGCLLTLLMVHCSHVVCVGY